MKYSKTVLLILVSFYVVTDGGALIATGKITYAQEQKQRRREREVMRQLISEAATKRREESNSKKKQKPIVKSHKRAWLIGGVSAIGLCVLACAYFYNLEDKDTIDEERGIDNLSSEKFKV